MSLVEFQIVVVPYDNPVEFIQEMFILHQKGLTELLCMVEMMLPPKNHEISNPAPGVFPKLS